MKPAPYFFIILAVLVVALGGSAITTQGLDWYYSSLTLPAWTPPGWVISTAWTTIFILAGIAAALFWRQSAPGSRRNWTVFVFLLNGALNVLWSYLFFDLHQLGLAVVEMHFLNLTTIALVALLWPVSRVASVLLIPYIAWVSFATYLAYTVWQLNIGFV